MNVFPSVLIPMSYVRNVPYPGCHRSALPYHRLPDRILQPHSPASSWLSRYECHSGSLGASGTWVEALPLSGAEPDYC